MLANYENRVLYMGNGSYRTYCPIEDEENYEYSAYDSVEFEAAETYAEPRGWDNEYLFESARYAGDITSA